MSGNPTTYHGVNAVVLTQHHNTSERILRHIANAYRLIYQGNFSITDAVQKIVDQVPMSEEIENIVNFVKSSERGDCKITIRIKLFIKSSNSLLLNWSSFFT